MSKITRDQVPVEETWDLTPIFESDEAWEKSYLALEKELEELEHEVVLSSASDVLEAIRTFDQLLVNVGRTSSYALYKFSEDGTDTSNQTMLGRAQFLREKTNRVKTNYVNALISVPQDKINKYKTH
ncbi:hypothetical protein DS745_09265 [Anaerobacillus alkaliphilus]|uniref:Oligoendopeptidase F n=1 Tax=Anaerobacillus alkaliphilus TaxID=1548597 RepID=A0A4Q0VW02_9BACI|nr:hypothetical protein [Anaerobacillus alkaliphilus]RXJ01660.1 hypothetical protein DS745_09265 [Anaerobacillus alkaliphilus]